MNHKAQNNLHIIHFKTKDGKYYCNQAVKSFEFKMTEDPKKVTCNNCIKRAVLKIIENKNV